MLSSVTRFLEQKLKLRVNREKSAVAFMQECKFLAHRLLSGGRLGIAPQSLERAKERLEQITRRNRGVSFEQVIGEVNRFNIGWVTFLRHAACKRHLVAMDKWLRHCLRCLRLKQCKRTKTIADFLHRLGVPKRRAWIGASSGKGWWRTADTPPVQEGMSEAWFESQNLVNLTERYVLLNRRKKPPDTMSMSGGVGGRGPRGPLLPDYPCTLNVKFGKKTHASAKSGLAAAARAGLYCDKLASARFSEPPLKTD